ncbi:MULTISPECIES: DUF6098 family protein [Micrococcaceae]|uniref:Uncharacterized protein n=1 Tax=Pseudarthrobacter siccitolerans TaxID=861266 RepID=A0ABU0PGK0_9MICC|nr:MULTISPECIES: DUF6098 family protein [Micrococcaceae]MDQ0672692.1 hypothetical protein [Pseudarthrobacter siccitolerans]MDQ0691077.1 hypothetical protein [Arthrobacter sp. W4I7]
MPDEADEGVIGTLRELEDIVRGEERVYVRYSRGYEADAGSGSTDTESGLTLPGLSVNPLTPEEWWTRPLRDWLARQICQYLHLGRRQDRHAWILTGKCVGRGPDCEPLLADIHPLGRLTNGLLEEAERVYEERFNARQGP